MRTTQGRQMLYNHSKSSNYFMGKGMTLHFLDTRTFLFATKLKKAFSKEIGCKKIGIM